MGVAGWGVREFCAVKDEVYIYIYVIFLCVFRIYVYHIISYQVDFCCDSLQLFFGAHFFVDHLLPEVASCKNHTEMFRVVDFLFKYDYEA